ncbi:30S ribosomal protein S8e [Candidatus Pacearchaeota archaeon]|nr:30S ribosomal protein S8e [Candidatus Pacearchaeota archaeon]
MATKKGIKITGGKYKKQRKKRKEELAGQKRVVKLSPEAEDKKKNLRVRGGNKKTILLRAKFINIQNPKNKKEKAKKLEIQNVIETPSNRFFARQNILTKGTIVETKLGKAKITNRPTQEGMINGILVE